ncbi:MAG: hypothetical protein LBV46_04125, partial [Bacteroidales bacterium]|nr:hypothetical protein [Bacteroidales bacterium]
MKKAISSIKFILLGIMVLLLSAATFIEKYRGSEFMANNFYHSWWFFALWGLLAVAFLLPDGSK